MLHKELGIGLSQVSYHVKELKKFGLIELTKTEPRRGANEHFYRATKRVILPEGMAAALPKSARSVALHRVLKLAEKDLKESLEAGTFDDRPDHHRPGRRFNLTTRRVPGCTPSSMSCWRLQSRRSWRRSNAWARTAAS